jgi:GH15 family glucan-1,4-alpha-glucosidase
LGAFVLAQAVIVSQSNDAIRRQLGAGMPTPARDYATERYSIKHTDHVQEPKPPLYMIIGGVVMVQEEDGGYRHATAEEYAEIMGDVVT